MRPNEIKSELVLNKISQASIARELGLSRTAVCTVINKRGKSHKVRTRIAKRLKMDFKAVWGEDAA